MGCTRLAAEHKSPSQQPTPVAIAAPLVAASHRLLPRGQPLLCWQHCQVAHGGAAVWAVEGRIQLGQARQDAALLLPAEGAANHDRRAARAAGQHVTHPASAHERGDRYFGGGAHAAGCRGQIMTLCGRAHAAGCMGLQEATQQAYVCVCVVSVAVHHVTRALGRQLDKTMRRRQLTFWGGCPLVVSPQLLSGPTAPAAPPHPMHLLHRQHTAQHMRWRVSGAECS